MKPSTHAGSGTGGLPRSGLGAELLAGCLQSRPKGKYVWIVKMAQDVRHTAKPWIYITTGDGRTPMCKECRPAFRLSIRLA